MAKSEKFDRSLEIKALVQEMKMYNNPEELEALKKELKKNVPLSMRGYLMAYLYLKSGNRAASVVRQKTDNQKRNVQIPEDAVSLYVNVGKASRRPARELVEFICETAKLDSSEILSVVYKQNYSFIYVSKDKAEGVIEAVNGQSYRDRKVKMNYSKEAEEN